MFYAEVALVHLFLGMVAFFLYQVYRLVWRRASDTSSGGTTTTGSSEATGSGSSGESAATPATQASADSDSAMIRIESKLSVG